MDYGLIELVNENRKLKEELQILILKDDYSKYYKLVEETENIKKTIEKIKRDSEYYNKNMVFI